MFYSAQKKQVTIYNRRTFFLFLLKLSLFTAVGWRIYNIQILDASKYKMLSKKNNWSYPTYQINGLKIDIPIQHLDLFINNIDGTIQEKAYNLLIKKLKKDHPVLEKKNKGIQYTVIDGPLQLLNMVYPNESILSEKKVSKSSVDKMYGKNGLTRLISVIT